MDVLILSASFGGGHRAVCEAIEEQLKNNGIPCLILDPYNEMNPKLNSLNSELYVKLMRYAPCLYGLFYDLTYNLDMDNVFNRLGSLIGRSVLEKLLVAYKPKVVVSTYPTYTGMLSYLKEIKPSYFHSLTVITDFFAHSQWIHKNVDRYFVASEEVALNLIKKGISPASVEITGIPVKKSFLELYDRGEVIKKYGLRADRPIILVMNLAFGNYGVYDEVLRCLSDLSHKFQAVVITGRDEKLYRKVIKYEGKLVPIASTINVAELMSVAYLLISKSGGITTSEALSMGLPMVFYKPVPGQEWHNADYVSRHGAGVIVKKKEELKNILNALLEHSDLCAKMKERAMALGKPHAAKLIARYISDALQKL